MEIPDKIFFKIGEVSDVAGVKPYVLRYWESEFSIVPHKSSSGQRLYRRKDIERILLIKRLLYQEGYTIAGARKHLAKYGKAGAESLDESRPSTELEEQEAERLDAEQLELKASDEEDVSDQGDGLEAALETALDETFALEGFRAGDEQWLESVRTEVRELKALLRTAKTLAV